MIPQLTPTDLAQWREDASRDAPVLVDVREPWEFERGAIEGSLLIPLGEIPDRVSELPRDKSLVMICRPGRRSQNAALFLEQAGFKDVYNLEGGFNAWALQVDPTMKPY